VRANREYRLLVSKHGHAPALLADPDRTDSLEIVEIASGEVILFWDCTPRDAGHMARAIRADLSQLEADEFLDRWNAVESPADLSR
jgi:hypothetical protein